MLKVTVFFIFLTVVYCANVYRQGEQDIKNPFMRYRYTDGNQEQSNREWQMRREIERRYQRQRQRTINQQLERLAEWFEGDDDESEWYERGREQPRWRLREEEEYERSVQPYWTAYESQVNPWEAFTMPYLYY